MLALGFQLAVRLLEMFESEPTWLSVVRFCLVGGYEFGWFTVVRSAGEELYTRVVRNPTFHWFWLHILAGQEFLMWLIVAHVAGSWFRLRFMSTRRNTPSGVYSDSQNKSRQTKRYCNILFVCSVHLELQKGFSHPNS